MRVVNVTLPDNFLHSWTAEEDSTLVYFTSAGSQAVLSEDENLLAYLAANSYPTNLFILFSYDVYQGNLKGPFRYNFTIPRGKTLYVTANANSAIAQLFLEPTTI